MPNKLPILGNWNPSTHLDAVLVQMRKEMM